MLSPLVLRYIEDRRVVLEKGRRTVKLFNWPRGHLADYDDDCEVLLQVKVPAKSREAAALEPPATQTLASPSAAAAVGDGSEGCRGGADTAVLEGAAAVLGDHGMSEGCMQAAAGADGIATSPTAACLSPGSEAGRGLSLLAEAAEGDVYVEGGGFAGGAGVWSVPMVVVEEASVLLRTYKHVGAHRSACQLIRLLRLLDDFVGWRVIYLEKVRLGLGG
jgi:hypothetical protein